METSGIGGLCTASCHAQESAIQSVRASRLRRKLSDLLRLLPQFGTNKSQRFEPQNYARMG